MARRSRSLLRETQDCGGHKPFASEHDAAAAVVCHPISACVRCRLGKVFHIWACGRHYHASHQSVERMAAYGSAS